MNSLSYRRIYSVLVCLCLLLQACTDEPETSAQVADNVLVTVNGTVIDQWQLDTAVDGLLGNGNIDDQQITDNVLDSLIASRAMMLLQENVLSDEQKQAIERQIAKYKEDLLVKAYVNRYAAPEPISADSVKAYYLQHPHEFSGDTVKQFEYISSEGVLDDDTRSQLLLVMNAMNTQTNVQQYATRLQKQGLPVQYKKAQLRYSLLQPPLQRLVINTDVQQLSAVYDARQIMRLKVLNQYEIPPKPLHQVSAEIRAKLAPVQLKKAIKALAESAKKQVNISYSNDK